MEPLDDVREDVDVKFPKPLVTSTLPEKHIEAERQVKEVRWKKEKMQDDIQREQVIESCKVQF